MWHMRQSAKKCIIKIAKRKKKSFSLNQWNEKQNKKQIKKSKSIFSSLNRKKKQNKNIILKISSIAYSQILIKLLKFIVC